MWTSLTSLAAKAQAVVKSVEQSVDSAMEAVDAPPVAPPAARSASADIGVAESARLRKRVVELEEEVSMRDAKITALEHLRAHPLTPRKGSNNPSKGGGGGGGGRDGEGDGSGGAGGTVGSAAAAASATAAADEKISALKAAAESSRRDGEWEAAALPRELLSLWFFLFCRWCSCFCWIAHRAQRCEDGRGGGCRRD